MKHDWRSALGEVVDERRRELGAHPSLDDLVAYHAGELAAERSRQVQDHLVFCPPCAELFLELDVFASDAAALPDSQSPASVVPIAGRRSPRQPRWIAAAAAIAAAALLVLWPRGGPLPEYDSRLDGEARLIRNDDAAAAAQQPALVATGGSISLKLQPASATTGSITARGYLRRGSELRSLSASTLHIDPAGVVSVAGTVGRDLHLPSGENELLLTVARPGALPSRQRLDAGLTADERTRGRRWVGLKRKIRVTATASAADSAVDSGPAGELPSATDVDPSIEYAGCRTIAIGPTCVLPGDRRLTLWVGHPRADEIRIDGGSWWVSHPRTVVQDGYRYEVEVGRWTEELVVEIHDGDRRSIWALEVRHLEPSDEWLKARELYDQGAWDEAWQLLEPLAKATDPEIAGPALSLLARIERRRGRAESGDDLYRQAIAAHRQAGRLFDEIKDASGLAYHLIEEKRFVEARELLDTVPLEATGGFVEGRNSIAYLRGLLAEETGDLRAAMAWMKRAAREAERGGSTRRWIFAMDLLARQLSTVGLTDAVTELHAQMQPQIAGQCADEGGGSLLSACDCARFDVNRAWAGLLALEAGGAVVGVDPAPLLAAAEQVFLTQKRDGEATCLSADDLPNLRLNLALAALHAGDPQTARRHLERARIDPATAPRLALWQLDVEGRIALAEPRPALALELYNDLGRRAELSAAPEAAWRAAFGRAMALAALHRTGAAVDACRQAEATLDRENLLVPMHAGRERFIAQRDKAARFCLDLLLQQDRGDEGLASVRRSAARVLRNLRVDASVADLRQVDRERWQRAIHAYGATRREVENLATRIWQGLPRDEEQRLKEEIASKRRLLRELLDPFTAVAAGDAPAATPAAEGALTLAYHPLPQGWAAFAADGGEVAVHRIELVGDSALEQRSREELASLLLTPFAGQIRRAKIVQIASYGTLRNLDFHALPFGDSVLLSNAPVVYSLGLTAAAAPGTRTSEALVVAGPGLLAAADEAATVQRLLESRSDSWRVALLANDATISQRVRQRLPEIDLFHYAGHADFDEVTRGWNSHLALANGGRLTIDDILATPGVPHWVVLSGCETGSDAGATAVPGVGLAQAFLVAGSAAVVAATDEVSDAEAAALMKLLYKRWQRPTTLAMALQQAQLQLRDQARTSDWQKFRILVRH